MIWNKSPQNSSVVLSSIKVGGCPILHFQVYLKSLSCPCDVFD